MNTKRIKQSLKKQKKTEEERNEDLIEEEGRSCRGRKEGLLMLYSLVFLIQISVGQKSW